LASGRGRTIRSRLVIGVGHIIGVWETNHLILQSFGFLHPKVVQPEAFQPDTSDGPRFPFVKVAGRGGNRPLSIYRFPS